MPLLIALIAVSAPHFWSCYDEVLQLSVVDEVMYARTSGGNMMRVGKEWQPCGVELPAQEELAIPAPPADAGAFCSSSAIYDGRRIFSFWGGKRLFAETETGLEPVIPRAPADGDYCLLSFGGELFAGTNAGLFAWNGSNWRKERLPNQLPFARVHGICKSADKYVIGGINGVAIGKPNNWKRISYEPVRQIIREHDSVWIIYGSGAVDKIDARRNRLYTDILHEAAKRPWTSCVFVDGKATYFAGLGGWVQKGDTWSEVFFPELNGQVITAMAKRGTELLAGTQGRGLFAMSDNQATAITPPDPWVIDIITQGNRVYVGTYAAGLFEVVGHEVRAVSSPNDAIRHMALWNGNLAVGTICGAFLSKDDDWEQLQTGRQEITCLSVIGKKLFVGTPKGLYQFG